MNEICPVCSGILLRHLQQREVTWFCSRCRQKMPNLDFSTMQSSVMQSSKSQENHQMSCIRPKLKTHDDIATKPSAIIDSTIHESKQRLKVVSFVLERINAILLDANSEIIENATYSIIARDELRLADFWITSETVFLFICQAILTRDISLLHELRLEKLKAEYAQLNVPTEFIICSLYWIKILAVDFSNSIAVNLSDSLLQQNQRYLASEIASYFDVVIASMI